MANITTPAQGEYGSKFSSEGLPLPDGVVITKVGTMRKRFGRSQKTVSEYTHGTCAYCQKRFIGIKQDINKGWSKRYCSRQCSGAGRRKDDGNGYYLDKSGYAMHRGKRIHIQVAEKALGRKLKVSKGRAPMPDDEVVHHINMDKSDFRNSNLLICNSWYHKYLHKQYELAFASSLII